MTAADHTDILATFSALLPPNTVKHGRLLGVDDKTGRKRVETREGQPVTSGMLARHLGVPGKLHRWVLGYLPGFEEGTPCGLIDLDQKDFPGERMEAVRSVLRQVCNGLNLHTYWERSSSGLGWHLWLFTDAPLPYGVMRDALRALLRRASIKAEVYPMGDTPASRWVITPYYEALRDERRLGRTWLELDDGQPIPVDELGEYITLTSAGRLRELAAEKEAPKPASAPSAALETEPGDLAPEAVGLLLDLARSAAPKGGRHDALAAFLNLGQRAGDLEGMADGLKADEVRQVWCPDGSRDAQDWAAEVDRWAENVQTGKAETRRGLPYLRETAGYTVPSLPKRAGLGLPEIVVNERHLREIAADAERVLLEANEPPTLFQRGGELVRVAQEEDSTRLKTLEAVALKGVLARAADFVVLLERTERNEDGKKELIEDRKPARPPADLAPDLLARVEHLGLPPLRTLARSPIYAPSGELVSAEGYHSTSGIFLALRDLTVPSLPSPSDALALLRELLTDFPFSPYEAGLAHALAALLLPFVRPMIEGPTPLHLIEAPTRGSGKGLLSEVIAHVALGGAAGVMVQPKDGDEFEKRVTSTLLEGARVILLDNVHSLKGEALAAILTARTWKGRRLGKSEMLTLPNDALWLATGNNVSLDDDMPRRIIPIRLDPGVERPEERTGFRHPDLLGWVKAHRPTLVAACLALVEAWKAAGRPRGSARLGSYESWAAVIGGILDVAGVAGFLTGREGLYETANAEPQEWAEVLAALYTVHGREPITAREFLAAMRGTATLLDLWEGKRDLSALQRIGHALRARRDRVFGGLVIRLEGKQGGSLRYRVEPPVGRGGSKTPETTKTSEQAGKSTADTHSSAEGVLPGFSAQNPQTPTKPPKNPSKKKAVLDDEKHGPQGVSGVLGVLRAPGSEDAVEL